MENVAIKGRGGNDVQHKNWKGKILRIWITIIRHGGLGHEVQEGSRVDGLIYQMRLPGLTN